MLKYLLAPERFSPKEPVMFTLEFCRLSDPVILTEPVMLWKLSKSEPITDDPEKLLPVEISFQPDALPTF